MYRSPCKCLTLGGMGSGGADGTGSSVCRGGLRRDTSGGQLRLQGCAVAGCLRREKESKKRRGNDPLIITPSRFVPSGNRLFRLRSLVSSSLPRPCFSPSSASFSPTSAFVSLVSLSPSRPFASCRIDAFRLCGPAANSCGRRERGDATACRSRCRCPPPPERRTECSGSSPSWHP